MKKAMIFCWVMVCMVFINRIIANEVAPLAGQFIEGKFYIAPGTVHIAPNGIFLNIEGNFVPVEAVSMDDCGVYCLFPSCSSKIHDWKCPREECGTWNGAWRIRCQRCGHPRPAGSFED